MRLEDHIDAEGGLIVRVTPRASRSRIVVESERVKVYVTVPPEDGKANAAICALIAKTLGVAKKRVTVLKGQTSRDKTLKISP